MSAGLAALATAIAACTPSAPAIQEVSPLKGETGVAGDAPIKATFDRLMDSQSVASRLEVEPGIAGCSTTSCPVTWKGQTMILEHRGHEFGTDTRYRVVIHPGYRDQAGLVNDVEHAWEFRTESAPSLRASTPGPGAKGVAPDADLALQFSRAMQQPTSDQVRLDPAVPLRVSLDPNDPSRVLLAPLRVLRPATRYRLELSSGLADVHGGNLGKPLAIDFTTERLDLSHSLAFAVMDEGVQSASRIGMLKPPASLTAPAPSVRLIYDAGQPIGGYGWSFDASHLYVASRDSGRVVRVSLADGFTEVLGILAASMSPSPARDELAYVSPDRRLHIWSAEGDLALDAAGAQLGQPVWSGDGRRLALEVERAAGAADSPGLAILDRETLSLYNIPAVRLAPGSQHLPAWSFDGDALAFERATAGSAEVWIFRLLAPPGAPLERVGTAPAAPPHELAWSFDGATLYAVAGEPSQLQRAPARAADGQAAGFAAIRNSRAGDDQPSTPSFDRRIAFVRQAAGQAQLWLVNSDGSAPVQLTFAAYDPADKLPAFGVSMPRWAPGKSASTGPRG